MNYKEFFDEREKDAQNQEDLGYVYRYIKKLDRLSYLNLLNKEIEENDRQLLENISQRLAQNEPAQYIVGDTDFYNLNLKVDPRALIPRPETEELVDLILKENEVENLKVLDVGTGTGAIGLSLKKARPSWQVTLADISTDALALANTNAEANNLSVDFVQSDVFSSVNGSFDIIVSNPPYIAYDEQDLMDESVIKYEPDLALYATESGLAIYNRLAANSEQFLSQGGKIYLEIGFNQGQAVKNLFQKSFPKKEIRILPDLAGLDRMVVISDNGEVRK
ncbi:protein-(glutamine-N5) methyltransferase, release factor-specific [Floricoccus tropicus]|uniref:Release factor glutamine methyltransferase n=1 Tax=Floricoccus tropicus TaxID=1859473 RepID=A0A1E8GNK1_9LACT|nr:peptide chain release factor N(5)-glutamine methyltransferase [Floricoccus tropicus]OFI49203.1 protein-(glutamine-N5) methyltransferase, release factor-specific [Floricoccus tropicus]